MNFQLFKKSLFAIPHRSCFQLHGFVSPTKNILVWLGSILVLNKSFLKGRDTCKVDGIYPYKSYLHMRE